MQASGRKPQIASVAAHDQKVEWEHMFASDALESPRERAAVLALMSMGKGALPWN
jgi:hypothetical protein